MGKASQYALGERTNDRRGGLQVRSSLPEFIRWQNALRPEDSGHYDARTPGTPGADASTLAFDAKVVGQLESRLGVVRNNFTEEEARLWAEHARAEHAWRTGTEALRAAGYDGPTDAPVVEPALSPSARWGALVLIGMGLTVLIAVLAAARGAAPVHAAAISAVLCTALIAGAYACGLLIRRAASAVARWATFGCLGVLAASVVALCAVNAHGDLSMLSGQAIGLAAGVLLLVVALVAYLATVTNPQIHRLRLVVAASHGSLLSLKAQREENRIFHVNVAERHRALAQQMADTYRYAYRQALGDAATVPPALLQPPLLPAIDVRWFDLMGEVRQ